MITKNWYAIAEAKRISVVNAIPTQWRIPTIKDDMKYAGYVNTNEYLDTILPKEELAITKLTMLELQEKIASGALKSLAVAEAYCHRAALAQQILNCCSEIFFDKALQRAKELDEHYTKTGKVSGNLHGIPISLKDQVDLPGFDSSIGYVALLNKPKTQSSLLAEYLYSEGAVFYVKTTVPMAMMAPETTSNVYGYTYNSQNINLASGGSSGGEGSLIGAGASPMGFGTDIGGSIRIPSAFNGLYALKPSTGRISYLRVTNSYSGQETMPSVIGPMARSFADIKYITQLIVNAGLWESDPNLFPIPFRETKLDEKLTFGLWKFDGKVMPHPPILRALEKTAQVLKAQGHEVIEIQLPDVTKINETTANIFTADEGYEVEEMCKLSGEPVVPEVHGNITLNGKPRLTVNPWWDLCKQHYERRQDFLSFWNDTANVTESKKKIDAIIAPVWPSASFLPGTKHTLNYTAPFNLFDCASVVLPVTNVDKEVDLVNTSYTPIDSTDDSIYKLYNPEVFDKMPVCIQVVGKRLEEEKTLSVASVIQSFL